MPGFGGRVFHRVCVSREFAACRLNVVLEPNAKAFRNEAALRWPVTVSNNGLNPADSASTITGQGTEPPGHPGRPTPMFVRSRMIKRRFVMDFVGQGGTPTLQENDK